MEQIPSSLRILNNKNQKTLGKWTSNFETVYFHLFLLSYFYSFVCWTLFNIFTYTFFFFFFYWTNGWKNCWHLCCNIFLLVFSTFIFIFFTLLILILVVFMLLLFKCVLFTHKLRCIVAYLCHKFRFKIQNNQKCSCLLACRGKKHF